MNRKQRSGLGVVVNGGGVVVDGGGNRRGRRRGKHSGAVKLIN